MAGPRRRLAAAVATALLLALALAAPAQALRRLSVDALSMRADHTHLKIGQVFHLAIHAHARERIAALDELVIPDVGTMQLLGDERHVTASASGTDVVETLTLEPTQSGTFTFNGAYLDAIEARTGKPSRFSANPVRVVVDPAGMQLYGTTDAFVRWFAGVLIGMIVILAGLTLGIVLVVRSALRRRPPAPIATPAAAAPPPLTPRTPRDDVADALRAYRTAPANGSLARLREALFAAAGANAGSTLRDALAATSDRALHDALAAAERTAFGPAHVRDASSDELIGATEVWLR